MIATKYFLISFHYYVKCPFTVTHVSRQLMQLQAIIINDVLMGTLIITPLKVGVLLMVIFF